MRLIRALATSALLAFAALPAEAQAPAPTAAPAGPPAPADDGPVQRGRYLATAADCMPCHTAQGGTPFAGGRALNTPFGSITSPNITPDPATGIGRWSADQFWGALHDGLRADGAYLYPVMPFTSYTRITRPDADAIFAYLRSLPPANAQRQPNGLAFPFDVRATLAVWRELFFRPAAFTPDPAKSAEWNRGAYLGTALGHCGECHTPRNIMGATERSRAMQGAVVDGWFAPDIAPADPRSAIAGWPVDRIAAWLGGAASSAKGTAFGPMGEVVHDSLSKLTAADRRALATWLADSAPPARPAPAVAEPDRAAAGLYLTYCAGCHQPLGTGVAGAIPPLAGNAAVIAAQPNNVVQAVLNGIPAAGNYGAMPSFAATLTDAQVADIANYVRTAWTPATTGAPATPAMVAALRRADPLAGASTDAARRLCPATGMFGPATALPMLPQGAFAAMRSAPTSELENRAGVLLADLRRDNPGVSDAALTDALLTAYCPVVANDPNFADDAARRAALDRFRAILTGVLVQPQVTAIDVTVPIPPAELARMQDAARAARMPLDAWIIRAAREAAGAGSR